MAIGTDPASYKKADSALLREIVAAADKRLESQLTASLAADQRALVLAGFLVPTIVALVGAAAALHLQQPQQIFLGGLAMAAGLGLLVSLILTVYTARPVEWSFPGIRPEAWLNDIASQKDEKERLTELAADAERRIGENAAVMARNGKCVRAALGIAALTLAAGGATTWWFFCCGGGAP